MKVRNYIFVFFLMIVCLAEAQQNGRAKTVVAQCCTDVTTKLQISKPLFLQRVDPFPATPLYSNLRQHAGRPHPLSGATVGIDNFFSILTKDPTATGLKIYFGAFAATGNVDDKYAVDNTNILVPIFVLTKQQDTVAHHDCSGYYIFDPRTQLLVPVLKESVRIWVNNYRKNLDMVTDETRSLWFNKADVVQWKNVLDCRKKCYPAMKEMIMYWGIYEADADGMTGIKNKLTLLFYVPGEPDSYKGRFGDGGAYDTSVPCPPGDNCSGDEFG